jgi:hypothetical protein
MVVDSSNNNWPMRRHRECRIDGNGRWADFRMDCATLRYSLPRNDGCISIPTESIHGGDFNHRNNTMGLDRLGGSLSMDMKEAPNQAVVGTHPRGGSAPPHR